MLAFPSISAAILAISASGVGSPCQAAFFFQISLGTPPFTAPVLREIGVISITYSGPDNPAVLLTPDGKVIQSIPAGAAKAPINPGNPPTCFLSGGRLSPDRSRLAAFKLGPIFPDNKGPWTPFHLWVFEKDSKTGPDKPLISSIRNPTLAWSTTGSQLFVSQIDPEKEDQAIEPGSPLPFLSWVYDFPTKNKTILKLPPGHAIQDVSPNGKELLTIVANGKDKQPSGTFLVPIDTLKPRLLTKNSFKGMRISPDGKWVIGCRYLPQGDKGIRSILLMVSVMDGSLREIPNLPENFDIQDACWSPDGSRFAYLWREVVQPNKEEKTMGTKFLSHVTVMDSEGKTTKTIISSQDQTEPRGLDWK